MSDEPKRPFYKPKPKPPKPATVVKVVDWTIAQVMFWKVDKKKK